MPAQPPVLPRRREGRLVKFARELVGVCARGVGEERDAPRRVLRVVARSGDAELGAPLDLRDADLAHHPFARERHEQVILVALGLPPQHELVGRA